ncbi:MAG: hypothetical protein HY791_13080 [Deltaproteobacteria bacterium]|nr:hypothetical protein [Deltaproteobacteria bacterium]
MRTPKKGILGRAGAYALGAAVAAPLAAEAADNRMYAIHDGSRTIWQMNVADPVVPTFQKIATQSIFGSSNAIARNPSTNVVWFFETGGGVTNSGVGIFDPSLSTLNGGGNDCLTGTPASCFAMVAPGGTNPPLFARAGFDNNASIYGLDKNNTSAIYRISQGQTTPGAASFYGTITQGGVALATGPAGDHDFNRDAIDCTAAGSGPFAGSVIPANSMFLGNLGGAGSGGRLMVIPASEFAACDAAVDCNLEAITISGALGVTGQIQGLGLDSTTFGPGGNNRLWLATTAGTLHRVGSFDACTGTLNAGSLVTAPAQLNDLTGNTGDSTVPVTIARVESVDAGKGVAVQWVTATETANAGFRLFVRDGAAYRRIGEGLVASHNSDSTEPQSYSTVIPSLRGEFYIADVDLNGKETIHGPFTVGQTFGAGARSERIDWAAIKRARPVMPLALPTVANAAEILVSDTGMQRVTFEALVAAGVDLAGAPEGEIAVVLNGSAVPARVVSATGSFGAGDFVEFYGQALETLYTKHQVYSVLRDGSKATRIGRDNNAAPALNPPTSFQSTSKVNSDKLYSFAAPGNDPWFEERILAQAGVPAAKSFVVDVNEMVSGQAATLTMKLWGMTSFGEVNPDHHVSIEVNGSVVANPRFDGNIEKTVTANIPAGVLVNGPNTVRVTVLGDTGTQYDLVHVERYSIRYNRSFKAQNGALEFTAKSRLFKVTGLPSTDVVAYRKVGSTLRQLTNLKLVKAGGTYSATFIGNGAQNGDYMVAVASAITQPAVRAARALTDITTGDAKYLVIAHEQFTGGLTDLVSAKQAQGLTVKVVDVADVYAQFNHGVVDPEAIRLYVAHAQRNMGTEYVLLVGGDTYDYFDNLGVGSVSFIPTPYAKTSQFVRYAPADTLLADVNQDGSPDVALGRLPVRTAAELASVIAKTVGFDGLGRDAIFAADKDAEIAFSQLSDGFADRLSGWNTATAYLSKTDLNSARNALISGINGGAAFTSYVGHSGPTMWTFDGLFTSADAAALSNTDPTVVAQWGCWNTYHVDPAYNTLAHKFLLGDHGAAAVLGASSLTQTASEQMLGSRVIDQLAQPGETIGRAVMIAKQQLAATRPELKDVLLGWTLLGDPALVLNR